MKLGPFEVSMGPKAPAPNIGELGATGTAIFGGVAHESEYNKKLGGRHSYETWDIMRNDGTVEAVLKCLKLPLLNANWFIEPPTDKPRDKEIAEYIETNLKTGMTTTFRETLRLALRHLDYGVMPFEKVWEMREGKIAIRKLAQRRPQSVIEWQVDETGGLRGIKQQASTSAGFRTIEIPAEKLLVFVNDMDGSDWRGRSILRSAYKHWFFKDGMYRVQAIGIEKRTLGIDVGTLKGENRTPEKRAELESVLMTLHAHEKQFFVEAEEQVTYRTMGIDGRVLDPQSAIDHHDVRIARSVAAEFLAMGTGSTGSLAMHSDKTGFFLMAEGAYADYVADTFSDHLVKPWVSYNWAVDEYPRMRHSRLETRDVKVYADALEKLTTAQVIHPDAPMEKDARELLDLPPADPSTATPPRASLPATSVRQVDKLIEVGANAFERRDKGFLASVNVPYRTELLRELEQEYSAPDAAAIAAILTSQLRAAFVLEMSHQIDRDEFDRYRLRAALLASFQGRR